MKKIVFVRHGKAEEEYHGINDFERSLTASGKKISSKMADIFALKEKSPGLFISSPAFRAIETAMIFAAHSEISYDSILLRSTLYFNANAENLMELLSEDAAGYDSVTLFGHNPSFSDMAYELCSGGCDQMPKSGVIGISFNVKSWDEITKGTGKQEYFLKPEKLL
ncbi:MAG TPA: histidine phosphatase family protein [Bacteroidales bacterium]|nr:histidine phosphatase family protein [Bacteroidales bacterium]